MRPVVYWLYQNFKYRLWPIPTDPVELEKIAMNLKVPLAFTYRAHWLDVTLAQQRIHESLKSFSVECSALFGSAILCFDDSCGHFGVSCRC
jgi:hypothetical protein